MRTIVLLIAAVFCCGATTYDVDTLAELQSAVAAAQCGDTISILAGSVIDNPNNAKMMAFPLRQCAVGNEIN